MAVLLPIALRALEPIEPDVGPRLLEARQMWEQGDQLGIEASRIARSNGDPIPLLDQQIALYDAAEMKYLEALKLSPAHPHALFDYGRLLAAQKRYRDARQRLEGALASPRLERAFLPSERADLMRTLGCILERSGGWVRAIELYRDAMKINPDDPRNRLSLAIALCAWDDPVESIELLSPWQAPPEGLRSVTPPIRALGLYTLGYALEEDGRYEVALQAYRQAETLSADAGTNDAIGVGEQSRLALRRLVPYVERLKRDGLVEALARTTQFCRVGWRHRQEALRDKAAFVTARQRLWDARTAQEKDQIRQQEPLSSFYAAVRSFEAAVQTFPGYARAYREQGLCYLALVELRAALPQLEASILYAPYSPGGLAALGETQLSSNEPEKAVETFRNLLRIEPEYGPAHLGLARALLRHPRDEREIDVALQSLDRAKSLGADMRTILRLEIDAADVQERLRKGEHSSPSHQRKERSAPEGNDFFQGSLLNW